MIDNHQIDPSNLSYEELRFHLDKYNRLKHTLGPRLPDAGSKLSKVIELFERNIRIRQNEGSNEKQRPVPTVPVAQTNTGSLLPDLQPDTDVHTESVDEGLSIETAFDAINNLSENFANLDVGCESPDEPADENLTCIPTLTMEEMLQIRRSLNLPNPLLSSFHWFVFLFRFVGSWVYLVVLDCASPERHLIRSGLRNTWFPQMRSSQQQNGVSTSEPPASLVAPTQAVRDLWQFVNQAGAAPCLISSSSSKQQADNLLWLGRLLRATRHSSASRIQAPSNCRFVDVSQFACISDEGSGDLVELCRQLKSKLLEANGRLKTFKTVHDFFHACTTRTLPWMEAPLELSLLLQLRTATSDPMPSSTRDAALEGLSQISDTILRRLAAIGLGRTRLTLLAGQYGWRGFAGLLAFHPSSESSELSKPLVTDCVETVQTLYRFFRHVYHNVDRHLRFSSEHRPGRRTRLTYRLSSPPDGASSNPVHDRIQPWISSGTVFASSGESLQLRLLDKDSSIELMRRAQERYQEARKLHNLPSYPSMPSSSTDLGTYRDTSLDPLDSSTSESESESAASDKSLHLEDVD